MNRRLFIFYVIALAFHGAVFFYFKPPAPQPPKMVERTYIDVALTAPPAPVQPKPPPTPPVPVQPQKVETPPPPKPEPKSEPPLVKTEMTIPTPKPAAPPPVVKPIVVSPPKPSPEYVPVTQPNYARRAQPIYPDQARRWHQQGIVTLALFINEEGVLVRVEIIKSSGYSLLDAAAVKAMKQSRFEPAMDGATPIRSRAEATVTFRLEQ